MGDADRRISCVDRLPTRSGRAESVNAQVFGLNLDVNFFGLGQHRYRNRRSVHTPLLFRLRNSLHAMDAALIFQLRINSLAFDEGNHFFQPTHARLGGREHLDLPALALGKARIHAEDLGGKERGFVSPGSSANFQHDVFFVVGVLGKQQKLQLFLHAHQALLQIRQLFLRVRAHLGVVLAGDEGFALLDATLQVFELAEFFHHGHKLAMRLGGLLVFRRVVNDLRRGQRLREFLIAGFDLF